MVRKVCLLGLAFWLLPMVFVPVHGDGAQSGEKSLETEHRLTALETMVRANQDLQRWQLAALALLTGEAGFRLKRRRRRGGEESDDS